MSYNDREADQQQQQSAELYTLTSGSTTTRLTSYYTDIVVDGQTYTHAPIKRSGFSMEITGSVPSLTIEAPIIAPFASYVAETPIVPTQVLIHKYFLYGASWPNVLMFSGTIKSVQVQQNVAKATCVSKEEELTRIIPRVLVQSGCNNNLYDNVCLLNRDSYKTEAYITTVTDDPPTLKSSDFPDPAVSTTNLKHGWAVYGDDTRFIIKHESGSGGSIITLHGRPFDGIGAGATVTVYQGCDKTASMCKNKFNNLDRFVGFPYVPSASPVLYDNIW